MTASPPDPGTDAPIVARGLDRMVRLTRIAVLVPAIVLAIAGCAAFIYGSVYFLHGVVVVSEHPFPVKDNLGLFLIDLDLFLIGATLLLIAVGFAELSLAGDRDHDRRAVPAWLDVRDLDDMKIRIMSMLTLIAVTSFVDVVVDFGGGRDIFWLGAGIALVVAAITGFLRFGNAVHRRR
jgi:uncharacterized membrane protein YqhA